MRMLMIAAAAAVSTAATAQDKDGWTWEAPEAWTQPAEQETNKPKSLLDRLDFLAPGTQELDRDRRRQEWLERFEYNDPTEGGGGGDSGGAGGHG